MSLSIQNLLSIRDLKKSDIELILKTARNLKEISWRPIKKVPALRGKTILLCFFEPSTRTRTSFEIAAKRLSADTINISTGGSSMEKGESLMDTVRNLEAMQPDLVVVRHASSGVPQMIANWICCPVINAGDGSHEHPTQALLDLMTIEDAMDRGPRGRGPLGHRPSGHRPKRSVAGLSVVIVGDILHSRVARSNIWLLKMMGAKVAVAGPATMIPTEIRAWGVPIYNDLKEVIPMADVLMMLRIQRERGDESLFPSLREYARYFGLNCETFSGAKPSVVIMHPGPVNRGVEIAPEIADGAHSVILDQVTNGVAIRMALLYLMCGGKEKNQKLF